MKKERLCILCGQKAFNSFSKYCADCGYWSKCVRDIVNNHKYRAKKFGLTEFFTVEEWVSLLEKHDKTCLRCGKKESRFLKIVPDHIVPLSKGGKNTIDNIQPLCMPCNTSKSDEIIDFRNEGMPITPNDIFIIEQDTNAAARQ